MGMRRHAVNKRASANAYNRGTHKTHVYNARKIQRGGWRL